MRNPFAWLYPRDEFRDDPTAPIRAFHLLSGDPGFREWIEACVLRGMRDTLGANPEELPARDYCARRYDALVGTMRANRREAAGSGEHVREQLFAALLKDMGEVQ